MSRRTVLTIILAIAVAVASPTTASARPADFFDRANGICASELPNIVKLLGRVSKAPNRAQAVVLLDQLGTLFRRLSVRLSALQPLPEYKSDWSKFTSALRKSSDGMTRAAHDLRSSKTPKSTNYDTARTQLDLSTLLADDLGLYSCGSGA